MKSKRKTMLIAALAVAVIALAGIGYAIGYQAYTESQENKIGAEYVELTIDGTVGSTAFNAYTGGEIKLEYNTRTTWDPDANASAGAEVIEYQLNSAEQVLTININASCNTTPASDHYTLVIGGLSDLSTDTFNAVWACNGTTLTSGTTITLTAQALDTIDSASLTLTITPKTTGNPATNVWIDEEPDDTIEIPTITFTLTNVA